MARAAERRLVAVEVDGAAEVRAFGLERDDRLLRARRAGGRARPRPIGSLGYFTQASCRSSTIGNERGTPTASSESFASGYDLAAPRACPAGRAGRPRPARPGRPSSGRPGPSCRSGRNRGESSADRLRIAENHAPSTRRRRRQRRVDRETCSIQNSSASSAFRRRLRALAFNSPIPARTAASTLGKLLRERVGQRRARGGPVAPAAELGGQLLSNRTRRGIGC